MNRTTRVWLVAIVASGVLAGTPRGARAFNIYKVDKDCIASGAYGTVQAAVNAAALSPGTDYVWIAKNHNYQETVAIADQDLIIEGGFTDCNDNDIGPNDRSSISGFGGTLPVIAITGTSHVDISNLILTDGNGGIFAGGAVRFNGQGDLSIGASELQYSQAPNGGGVYFNALGGPATLRLLDGTDISGNIASVSGGGIYVSGPARLLMLSVGTTVHDNRAANYGGGIYVAAPARIDIGAPGLSSAAIFSNRADLGGGIAVGGGGVARVFPHDATHPSSIADNEATLYGGAIYAEGDVCLFSPSLYSNSAVQGGAIFHVGSGGVYMNAGFPARLGEQCGPETVSTLGGVPVACDYPGFCNAVVGNTAASGFAGLYGAIIYEQGGELIASRLLLQDNNAGMLIQTDGKLTDIGNSLATNNSMAKTLVSIDNSYGETAAFTGSTFAHNTIFGSYVFEFLNGAGGSLTRDIIAQPAQLSAAVSGPLTVSYTMSNEIGTLPHGGNAGVVAADPQFADAATRDYHLRSSSPALDFAPAVVGDIDIEQANRSVDLPALPDVFGPTDLGAYERQHLCAADQIFCNGFDR